MAGKRRLNGIDEAAEGLVPESSSFSRLTISPLIRRSPLSQQIDLGGERGVVRFGRRRVLRCLLSQKDLPTCSPFLFKRVILVYWEKDFISALPAFRCLSPSSQGFFVSIFSHMFAMFSTKKKHDSHSLPQLEIAIMHAGHFDGGNRLRVTQRPRNRVVKFWRSPAMFWGAREDVSRGVKGASRWRGSGEEWEQKETTAFFEAKSTSKSTSQRRIRQWRCHHSGAAIRNAHAVMRCARRHVNAAAGARWLVPARWCLPVRAATLAANFCIGLQSLDAKMFFSFRHPSDSHFTISIQLHSTAVARLAPMSYCAVCALI